MQAVKLRPGVFRLAFLYLFLPILLVTKPGDAEALDHSFEFHLSSFTYSEPIAIKALLDEFDTKLGQGKLAFTQNRAWAAVKVNKVSVGAYSFYDYFMWFSEDTALLHYLDKNELPVPNDASFDLYLRASHVTGKGIRFQYDFIENQSLSLSIATNVFKTRKIIEGSITGFASGSSEQDDYTADLNINYFYDEDKLFDRPIENSPEGKGYSFDLYVSATFDQWQVDLTGLDLLRRIKWDDLPQTIATIETSTTGFDDRGFFVFNPVLRGKEIERNHNQVGGDRYQFQALYAFNNRRFRNLQLGSRVERYRQVLFHSILVNQQLSENLKFGMAYRFNDKSFHLQLQHRYIGITIGADDLDIEEDAKSLSFAIQFNIPY